MSADARPDLDPTRRPPVDAATMDPLAQMGEAAHRLTQLAGDLRGLMLNNVLFSGRVVLGVDGTYSLDFQIAMAAVALWNGTAAAVTVAGEAGGPVPTQGRGVMVVGAGRFKCQPLTGTMLTIYGAAGAAVDLAVYANPMPPAGGEA